jgi:hypothetical protein
MNIIDSEERIKRLEEEFCWLNRDMIHLTNLYKCMNPEVHTHFTMITENITCNACNK